VSRVIADVDQFADGLLMGFTQFFTGIMTIIGTLVFMFIYDWKITMVVVLVTPASFFIASFIAKRTYNMFKKQSEARGEQTSLIDEMIGLNVDQKQVSFIVADTPIRLKPNATDIQAWATNSNNSATNGEDGLLSGDVYTGVYYPWGLGTNVDGSEVMIPPSSIALRTILYSDKVAYPWFAPA
jgi:ABC-type transport system involved in cytochrome bd biosynthesis fused ATPase/permease subunit